MRCRESQREELEHTRLEMSLHCNIPKIPSCSGSLFFPLPVLCQVKVELMLCLFPLKDLAEAFCSLICLCKIYRHLDFKVMAFQLLLKLTMYYYTSAQA